MHLDNASVLVTGGASGLGRATAARLLARGATGAVLLDLPTSAGAHVAEALARESGHPVRFVPGDVRSQEDAAASVEAASELGTLRVAVNCAGTGSAIRTVAKDGTPHPQEAFEFLVAINLFGTFNVLRLAAAAMTRTEPADGGSRGVIVNTASVAAYEGQIGQVAYAASKGAITALTLPAARDLAAAGIRVVTIAPGLMDTPLLGSAPQQVRDALGAQVPHPARLGLPEEFGDLVAAVVGNDYLNGEVIRLDGAIRMSPK
ncbi:SDR family NAD(P)-dependent oxidoreductase (plasmid) [Embleya sp. NBC_00888]|uniref:SDR family NAD(P)-dependent oxidoreductase n=1 Tax=Embleya sp. NBC_00888 TaxID=2975960 RepID=UPI002F90C8A0|nr:SDR family NAD(P)-dependent oxidoreductase [Embleya sp. NBC_00888]